MKTSYLKISGISGARQMNLCAYPYLASKPTNLMGGACFERTFKAVSYNCKKYETIVLNF